jgi:hypothetical protein
VQGQGNHAVAVTSHRRGEIDHGILLALDGLADAMRLNRTSCPEISRSALQHAYDPLLQAFMLSQAVQDYGDICQSINELAMEMNAPITAADFPRLNRFVNGAAGATTGYERQQDQSTLNAGPRGKRFGCLHNASRTLVDTAMGPFEILRTGSVEVAGRTGSVLHRSLIGLRSLIRPFRRPSHAARFRAVRNSSFRASAAAICATLRREPLARGGLLTKAIRGAEPPMQPYSPTGLYWSHHGEVACSVHAPHTTDSRWTVQRWKPLAAASQGVHRIENRCQHCSSPEAAGLHQKR